ncbi:MAG TPA: FadR/GntR family transcriptional regulator [Roseiflexaceae bacterium]|nr:FadR/GntR family transcriptional regulator [Roseiflexaceae bacterium]
MASDRTADQDGDRFQAVARESTLANRVAAEIERHIVGGRIHPGERLPSERELAEQFGVSRTVIREAVRVLAAKSLLEVRSGSGTVARAPTPRSVSQSMLLLLRTGQPLDHTKVQEVRRTLEIEIAGIAAERRTAEDLAVLETLLGEMEALLRAPERLPANRDRFTSNDVQFHAALARATHNELFVVLLDSIADVLLEVRRMGFEVPGSHQDALAYHQAIFEQVRAGDPPGAREAMSVHLANAEQVMRESIARHRAE